MFLIPYKIKFPLIIKQIIIAKITPPETEFRMCKNNWLKIITHTLKWPIKTVTTHKPNHSTYVMRKLPLFYYFISFTLNRLIQ